MLNKSASQYKNILDQITKEHKEAFYKLLKQREDVTREISRQKDTLQKIGNVINAYNSFIENTSVLRKFLSEYLSKVEYPKIAASQVQQESLYTQPQEVRKKQEQLTKEQIEQEQFAERLTALTQETEGFSTESREVYRCRIIMQTVNDLQKICRSEQDPIYSLLKCIDEGLYKKQLTATVQKEKELEAKEKELSDLLKPVRENLLVAKSEMSIKKYNHIIGQSIYRIFGCLILCIGFTAATLSAVKESNSKYSIIISVIVVIFIFTLLLQICSLVDILSYTFLAKRLNNNKKLETDKVLDEDVLDFLFKNYTNEITSKAEPKVAPVIKTALYQKYFPKLVYPANTFRSSRFWISLIVKFVILAGLTGLSVLLDRILFKALPSNQDFSLKWTVRVLSFFVIAAVCLYIVFDKIISPDMNWLEKKLLKDMNLSYDNRAINPEQAVIEEYMKTDSRNDENSLDQDIDHIDCVPSNSLSMAEEESIPMISLKQTLTDIDKPLQTTSHV